MEDLIKQIITKQNDNLSRGHYCQSLDYQMEVFRDKAPKEFNKAMEWAISNPNLEYVI